MSVTNGGWMDKVQFCLGCYARLMYRKFPYVRCPECGGSRLVAVE